MDFREFDGPREWIRFDSSRNESSLRPLESTFGQLGHCAVGSHMRAWIGARGSLISVGRSARSAPENRAETKMGGRGSRQSRIKRYEFRATRDSDSIRPSCVYRLNPSPHASTVFRIVFRIHLREMLLFQSNLNSQYESHHEYQQSPSIWNRQKSPKECFKRVFASSPRPVSRCSSTNHHGVSRIHFPSEGTRSWSTMNRR